MNATNHRRGILKKMQVHIGPNMTPMVDVVMCILIFFMLGTSLTAPELFLKSHTAAIEKAGLGSMNGTQKLPDVRMNIKLARQGDKTYVSAFDEQLMPMDAIDSADQSGNAAIFAKLAARRKAISDDVQVLIVPDNNVPYQDVITIYDDCIKLAFKQVAFYPAK
jgi:biopolymer transport protein ExbD